MIKIAALDDNAAHLSLIEQALVGNVDLWDEPVDFKKFTTSFRLDGVS